MMRMNTILGSALLLVVVTPIAASGQVVGATIDYGWLADGRRFSIGDIVTVVVDEFTSASADRSSSAQEDRGVDGGAGFGFDGTTMNGNVSSGLGYESMQRGRDYRQDRLNSQVSVRVMEVEPNGALRIEGTKTLMIDEHEQDVTVRGLIRPQDITARNTVASWRIAEVEVLYATDGSLATADKGIISKFFGWIIP